MFCTRYIRELPDTNSSFIERRSKSNKFEIKTTLLICTSGSKFNYSTSSKPLTTAHRQTFKLRLCADSLVSKFASFNGQIKKFDWRRIWLESDDGRTALVRRVFAWYRQLVNDYWLIKIIESYWKEFLIMSMQLPNLSARFALRRWANRICWKRFCSKRFG